MHRVNRRGVAFVHELCTPFWFNIYSFSCFDLLMPLVYYRVRVFMHKVDSVVLGR